MDGLKTGNDALKKIHEILNIDEVEMILDQTREGIEQQREIDALISGHLTEEDDEAVEAELQDILDGDVELPDVPSDSLPEVPESVAEKPRKVKQTPSKVAVEA